MECILFIMFPAKSPDKYSVWLFWEDFAEKLKLFLGVLILPGFFAGTNGNSAVFCISLNKDTSYVFTT